MTIALWQAMCSEYVEERIELIKAISKDRKLSDIPKIHQLVSSSHIHSFHFISSSFFFSTKSCAKQPCFEAANFDNLGEGDKVFPLEMGHRLKR